ncbi:hypothetical protein D3C76_1685180 [compost metagenome]
MNVSLTPLPAEFHDKATQGLQLNVLKRALDRKGHAVSMRMPSKTQCQALQAMLGQMDEFVVVTAHDLYFTSVGRDCDQSALQTTL